MQFIYSKAPINYIDNIPAHKAGEWPGIKSCKFHSYKKVIRPVSHGIIFNEKEPLAPSTRKLLGPKGPSPEYVFKPSCKMVKPLTSHQDKPEGPDETEGHGSGEAVQGTAAAVQQQPETPAENRRRSGRHGNNIAFYTGGWYNIRHT